MIGVFNRSHYEDVLVVRVKGLVPDEVWRSRYTAINDFERLLTESGTTVLKFFLHISKDEQKERLEARIADPAKHWKFDPADLVERKSWDSYQTAFADALGRCSTPHAHGSWCRPTGSGSATMPWPRPSPTPWKRWTPVSRGAEGHRGPDGAGLIRHRAGQSTSAA